MYTASATTVELRPAGSESGEFDERPGAPLGEGSGRSLGSALGWVFAMLGFLIGSRAISDNSFFTHFANGRLILDGAGIPRVDPYSFTAAGESVTVQSWLPSALYAGLERGFGGWSIRILNGMMTALVAAGLWKLTAPARQLVPRVVLVGALVISGVTMWGPRPLLFGLVAMIVMLLVLDRSLPVWVLLPTMWLWVNSHGSFPLGLAVIVMLGVGRLLDERALPRHEMRVAGWAVLGVLLGAMNPLGWRLLWFPIHLMGRTEALQNVTEWEPPSFESPLGMVFIVMIGLHVVAARNGARWQHLLPSMAFVVAGLLAVRNLAPAALVFAMCLSPYLEIRPSSLVASTRGVLGNALTALAVAGIAVGATMAATQGGALDLEAYPMDEIEWLEARNLVANPDVKVVHREIVGNVLELRHGHRAHVFVDDRFDFYPLEVLEDHRVLIFGGDFREVLDRNGADVVLWQSDGAFGAWLDEADEWIVARESEDWLIACRAASNAAARCLRS